MYCNNCGVEGKVGNKFCKECGTKFSVPTEQVASIPSQSEVAATLETTSQQQDYVTSHSSVEKEKTSVQTDEYVKKGKEFAKSYMDFAKVALKNPSQRAKDITGVKQNFVLSIVTIIFVSLFLPLIMTINVSTASRGYVEAKVMQPFLYIIVFIAITAFVLFGVGKLTKSQTTFQDVAAKFGTLLIVPLLLLLASFVLSLLKIISISMLFFFIAILAVTVAIIQLVQILVAKGAKKVDPFYASLATLLILAVVIYLFGENMMNSINPFHNIF